MAGRQEDTRSGPIVARRLIPPKRVLSPHPVVVVPRANAKPSQVEPLATMPGRID